MSDISCTIKQLPPADWQQAARAAVAVNPANAPAVDALRQVAPQAVIEPQYDRYDIKTDKVDAGYPKPIAGSWPGLFTSSLSA